MEKELIVYAVLRKVADNMPNDDIFKLLQRVTPLVEGIRETALYKQVLDNLHSDKYPMPEEVAELLTDLDKENPTIDSTTILWLIGLRCAATMDRHEKDPEQAIQIQLMLFLVSQSNDFYRIEDDSMRLLVTYTYLQTASRILFKTDDN